MDHYLVAVGGLPGAGKSVAAKEIARRIGASLLRTDEVRKEIYPCPTYTVEESHHVYELVFRRAADLLSNRQSVVLDATFRQEQPRQQAREIAEASGALWRFVWITAPESLIRNRIARRTGDPSDASFQTYLQLRRELEPIQEPHNVLDNSGTLVELRRQIEQIFPVKRP